MYRVSGRHTVCLRNQQDEGLRSTGNLRKHPAILHVIKVLVASLFRFFRTRTLPGQPPSRHVLKPLLRVRDAIAAGREIGPRVYVAGNIIGWGGPFSFTYLGFAATPPSKLTFFPRHIQD